MASTLTKGEKVNKNKLFPALFALVLAALACTNNLSGSPAAATSAPVWTPTSTTEAPATESPTTSGTWDVQYYTGATQLMKDFVFTAPDKTWEQFPNVDYRNFQAKNGLEYGQELSVFCQQDVYCDFPVAARSYRSITADYKVEGLGECHENGTGIGCAALLFNVGDVTASFRDQSVDTGHTITGLYWNGNENDQAISALASHLAYRMIGIPTGNPANPGANCSIPSGCKGVDITFGIFSGNELLVRGHTVVR